VSPIPAGPTRGTVLVVEDDADVLDGMVVALQTQGYRVLTARDGARALTVLAGTRADVILLDLTMPIMSGWEFLEARVADPQLAATPVIVVSAARDVSADSDTPPWDAVIEKPFGIELLVREIETILRRSRGRSRATPGAGVPTAPR
jgi:DNA-binding response OmpR family regulator